MSLTVIDRTELILATAKRTFVAFCFGLILSLLFSVAAALKFEPIVKLERESSDFGLRVANAVFSQSYGATDLPHGTSPLFLVDIDASACAVLADASRCNFDRIMQPEVVDAVAKIIAQSKPKIVVLDALLTPDNAAGFLEQTAALGVPILTPMELTEFEGEGGVSDPKFGYLLDKSLCGTTECGSLSYHPAQIYRYDGKTRFYPTELSVQLLNSLDDTSSQARVFATMAYRAAKLGSADGELFDTGPEPEINYTVPSFSFRGGGERIDPERYGMLANAFRGNVEHLTLSNALVIDGGANGQTTLDFAAPQDNSILVIGSTALSGQDFHNTPLGPMGGMEVVANAIRSLQLASPETVVSPLEGFFIKFSALIKALIVIALTEVSIALLAQKRRIATQSGEQTVACGRLFDRWSIWIVLAMLFAFTAELCVAGWAILSQAQSSAGTSQAVDVIWPIVGVTASAFIGFSSEILSKLELIAERVVSAIAKRLSKSVDLPDTGSD